MGQVLVLGLTLLFRPQRTWRAIRQGDDPPTLTLIGVYVLIFAALPLLGRALGHVLLDWSTGALLLDALLYPVLCLLAVFGLGLVIGAAVPLLDGTEDRAAALHLHHSPFSDTVLARQSLEGLLAGSPALRATLGDPLPGGDAAARLAEGYRTATLLDAGGGGRHFNLLIRADLTGAVEAAGFLVGPP